MKKTILSFLLAALLSIACCVANASDILFEYDDSGNCIVKRKTIVISGMRSMQTNLEAANTLENEETVESDWLGQTEILILPNPTKGMLGIEIRGEEASETLNYTLLSTNGRRIERGVFSSNHHILDMTPYPAGVYILQLKRGREVKEWKIIKE